MSKPVVSLRSLLEELGAVPLTQEGDGPFLNETYQLERVCVALQSDYGSWRVNLSYDGRPFFPASFWLAALSGSRSVPVPAVTEEDLSELTASLRQVVAQAAVLSPMVEAMGADYCAGLAE